MVVSLNIFCRGSDKPDLLPRDSTAVTAKYATTLSCHPRLNKALLSFQNLAPIYEQLADAFSHAKDKVIIAKVDADGEGRPVGQKYGVTGFPSGCSLGTLSIGLPHRSS